jgi:hypothetical protein
LITRQSNKSIVQSRAHQNTEKKKELTTKKEHVLFAEKHSRLTKNHLQERAQAVVVTNIELLKTKHDVYNISVEGTHEYYANGVLSHNCDSLRYLINELPDDPERLKTKAYAPGTRVKDAESHLPYALQSPKNNTYGKNDWYSKYY